MRTQPEKGARRHSGLILVMTALLLTVLLISAAIGIDISRRVQLQNELQNLVDRAAMAGCLRLADPTDDPQTDAEAVVKDFTATNLVSGVQVSLSQVIAGVVTFDADGAGSPLEQTGTTGDYNAVRVVATVPFGYSFGSLAGLTKHNLEATATASLPSSNVVLALDASWSLLDGTRLINSVAAKLQRIAKGEAPEDIRDSNLEEVWAQMGWPAFGPFMAKDGVMIDGVVRGGFGTPTDQMWQDWYNAQEDPGLIHLPAQGGEWNSTARVLLSMQGYNPVEIDTITTFEPTDLWARVVRIAMVMGWLWWDSGIAAPFPAAPCDPSDPRYQANPKWWKMDDFDIDGECDWTTTSLSNDAVITLPPLMSDTTGPFELGKRGPLGTEVYLAAIPNAKDFCCTNTCSEFSWTDHVFTTALFMGATPDDFDPSYVPEGWDPADMNNLLLKDMYGVKTFAESRMQAAPLMPLNLEFKSDYEQFDLGQFWYGCTRMSHTELEPYNSLINAIDTFLTDDELLGGGIKENLKVGAVLINQLTWITRGLDNEFPNITSQFDMIQPGFLNLGTNISDGLYKSKDLLLMQNDELPLSHFPASAGLPFTVPPAYDPTTSAAKRVILISDGMAFNYGEDGILDNEQAFIEARLAAEALKDAGIEIFAIGVGQLASCEAAPCPAGYELMTDIASSPSHFASADDFDEAFGEIIISILSDAFSSSYPRLTE